MLSQKIKKRLKSIKRTTCYIFFRNYYICRINTMISQEQGGI